MFVIFGWGKQTLKSHGPIHIYHCDHCNNDKNWLLYSKKTWFTLFFIPIIPYKTENAIMCPICKCGIKLTSEQFTELKAVADCNMDLINKKINEDEYANRIKTLSAAQKSKGYVAEDNTVARTETQQNYIREIQEYEREKKEKSDNIG